MRAMVAKAISVMKPMTTMAAAAVDPRTTRRASPVSNHFGSLEVSTLWAPSSLWFGILEAGESLLLRCCPTRAGIARVRFTVMGISAPFAPPMHRRDLDPMPEPTKDLLMRVEGMSCQGCVETVTRTVRTLDPEAKVEVDLERGRLRAITRAQSIEVAEALSAAGYEATAMTG